ncbi:hypothetical protein VaNZ11_003353 [Volvox africanus]|uniref:Uncharacterized protein n=1 Tax=Volvox africanus TaxID=51714 RepID=A0ABQ5RU68_9CHLO|nr:hypothetical protein VaNZ11_003353 [Volvox africanus]
MQSDDEDISAGGTWTGGIHPKSIPGALKIQQEAIGKLQRNLRMELAKLQAEETILKLMIKRERKRLARWARKRGAEVAEGQQEKQEQQQGGPLEEGKEH